MMRLATFAAARLARQRQPLTSTTASITAASIISMCSNSNSKHTLRAANAPINVAALAAARRHASSTAGEPNTGAGACDTQRNAWASSVLGGVGLLAGALYFSCAQEGSSGATASLMEASNADDNNRSAGSALGHLRVGGASKPDVGHHSSAAAGKSALHATTPTKHASVTTASSGEKSATATSTAMATSTESSTNTSSSPGYRPGLPVYTAAEVAKHRTAAGGSARVWVTYGDGVYDITDFVAGLLPSHHHLTTTVQLVFFFNSFLIGILSTRTRIRTCCRDSTHINSDSAKYLYDTFIMSTA